MKRTTIFGPEQLHESLRQAAFRVRVSMAETASRGGGNAVERTN